METQDKDNDSINYEICPDCPLMAALEVATELLKDDYHNTPMTREGARGSNVLDRLILAGLVKKLGCSHPNLADNAYLICPHTRSVSDTRANINGPPPQALSAFNFRTYSDSPEEKPSTGQYL